MKRSSRPSCFFCFILTLILSYATHAKANDIQLGGMLLNKTITWFGQDFFNYFAREWRNQPFVVRQELVIEEIPSARRGTQVVIRYKDKIVFQSSIAATRNQSRANGSQAVSIVLSRVQSIDLSGNRVQFQDLSLDEI